MIHQPIAFLRGAVLRFCRPCNARDRVVVAGRCSVCGRAPTEAPAPVLDHLDELVEAWAGAHG